MARLKLILSLIVIVALVAIVAIQYQTGISLHAENENLRRQLAELSQLRAENERLSNLVAHADSSAAQEQLLELLRFRAEVTSFRKQTNELEVLRRQNQQLSEHFAARENVAVPKSGDKLPPDVPAEDIHPKEAWVYAGYTTPDAALQSTTWAMSQINKEIFMAGIDPDSRETKYKEADFEKQAPEESEKIQAFRIVQRYARDDTAFLTVYIEDSREGHDGKTVNLSFKYNGGQWQMVGPAGEELSRMHSAPGALP
jgi:hypothetical protein